MTHSSNILETTIDFTGSFKQYADIRHYYKELAVDSSLRFEAIYMDYKNISNLMKNGPQDGLSLIIEAIEKASDTLITLGDYSSTPSDFYDKYFKSLSVYSQRFTELQDQYMSINLDEEEYKRYKRAHSASGGRFVGGGFGIEGAAKGIAIAGAANLATDATKSIFNMFGNMRSDGRRNRKLKELYKNKDTCINLSSAIYQDIFNVHLALYIAMEDLGYTTERHLISNESINKSNSILNNIISGKISNEPKQTEALLSCLRLNPFNEKIYETLILRYPKEQLNIDSIAEFCNVDMSYFKLDILMEYLKTSNIDSEDNINLVIQNIHKRASELNFKDYEALITYCETRLEEIDELKRTVEGHVYETRENAETAKSEKNTYSVKLDNILSQYKKDETINRVNLEADTQNLIDEINNRKCIYVGIIEIIESLNELKEKLKYFEDYAYNSSAIAQQATKEKIALAQILESSDLSKTQELMDVIERVKNNLEVYSKKDEVLNELDTKLQELMVSERTVSNIIYDTKDEAQKAKSHLKTLQNEATELTRNYSSDKDSKFFVKGDTPNNKLMNFATKAKRLFDYKLDVDEIYAYIDDTALGGGADGIGLTADSLIITASKGRGAYPLSSIRNIQLPSFLSRDISFSLEGSEKKFSYDTYHKSALDNMAKLLQLFVGINTDTDENTRFESTETFVGINIDTDENTQFESTETKEVVNERIHEPKFVSNRDHSIYVAPDLNIEKINNFTSKTNKKYKTELCLDDIYAYYDETVFGSGDKGVCVTSSHIVVLVDDIGIVPIEQIEDIEISGAFNKKITLILKDKQKLSFILTQSNKGAETLVDVINYIKSLSYTDENTQLESTETKEVVNERIHEPKFVSNKDHCIYVAPDLNIEKTNNFISKTNKKYKTELCLDDIYAYYDDTVFGSGDKGVCVTSSHIVVLVYDIGIVPIEQIEDIKISGALNKKITLILRDKQKLSFVLTQSNKGAETLVDIIQHSMIG